MPEEARKLTERQCLDLARRAIAEQFAGSPLSEEVIDALEHFFSERQRREAKISSLKRSLAGARKRAHAYQALLEAHGLGPVPTAADGLPALVDDKLVGEDGSRWVVRGYSPANGPYNVIVKSSTGPAPRPLREVKPEWMRHAPAEG